MAELAGCLTVVFLAWGRPVENVDEQVQTNQSLEQGNTAQAWIIVDLFLKKRQTFLHR